LIACKRISTTNREQNGKRKDQIVVPNLDHGAAFSDLDVDRFSRDHVALSDLWRAGPGRLVTDEDDFDALLAPIRKTKHSNRKLLVDSRRMPYA
jgi:hypothetical protein